MSNCVVKLFMKERHLLLAGEKLYYRRRREERKRFALVYTSGYGDCQKENLMSNALAGVAYDSVLKYAPIDALRERAINQTIHACLLLFPLENAELISHAVEEAWRLHMLRHRSLSEQKQYHQHGEQEEDFGDVLEHQLLRERLLLHLDDLSIRERQVIELRFGLLDNRCYSREEVGRRMRVTRERIRAIEERALRKLRDYLA